MVPVHVIEDLLFDLGTKRVCAQDATWVEPARAGETTVPMKSSRCEAIETKTQLVVINPGLWKVIEVAFSVSIRLQHLTDGAEPTQLLHVTAAWLHDGKATFRIGLQVFRMLREMTEQQERGAFPIEHIGDHRTEGVALVFEGVGRKKPLKPAGKQVLGRTRSFITALHACILAGASADFIARCFQAIESDGMPNLG